MSTRTTQTLSEQASAPGPGGESAARLWPMHARGVGQMLDLAVDLFVVRCVPVVGIVFLMWLPVRLFSVNFGPASADGQTELLQAFLGFVGSVAVQTLSVALAIQVVYVELQGRKLELKPLLLLSAKRAPALLLCTILITGVLWFGFLCLIAPGVYLMYIWSVAPAALVLEGSGPIRCLVRSKQLVGKNFLPWAGLMLSVFALKLPYDAAVGAIDYPDVVDYAVTELGWSHAAVGAVRVLLGSLLMAVSSAAWSIVVTVFYLDCRVRREGFDLSMRLERLQDAARPALAP